MKRPDRKFSVVRRLPRALIKSAPRRGTARTRAATLAERVLRATTGQALIPRDPTLEPTRAAVAARARYRRDILAFVREILGGEPNAYQAEILSGLVEHQRVTVRGPHGLGKTTIAAWAALWCVTCHEEDVKVVCTASAWRQLEKFLFPEIHKWANRADWDRLGQPLIRGKQLFDLSLKLDHSRELFAVASDNPALIEGAHARVILYVFDEAKAIPAATWDAAEGAFSTAGADTNALGYALAISTPGEPSGRFFDLHARKPGYEDWWVRHVTVDEAIAAGRMSAAWVEQRRAQWGETSAVYRNRVLGEFDQSGAHTVIPLAWVEQANERWEACGGRGPLDVQPSYGLDVARFGTDKTVLARVVGGVLEALYEWQGQDLMSTVGAVAQIVHVGDPLAIDVIGMGAGVFDRLRELGHQVLAVNVAEKTLLRDHSHTLGFPNLRSALWWRLRERLDPDLPDAASLPPHDGLTGDLSGPHYGFTSAGLIRIEDKDEIRKRIGRSTDYADAWALAEYGTTARAIKLLWG